MTSPSKSGPLRVRVSMDGAQRLIDAWRDGRLERALGFPIESLKIVTPFEPSSPGSGGTDGAMPQGPARKSGLGTKVGLAVLIFVLVLLLLWVWGSEPDALEPDWPEAPGRGWGEPRDVVPQVLADSQAGSVGTRGETEGTGTTGAAVQTETGGTSGAAETSVGARDTTGAAETSAQAESKGTSGPVEPMEAPDAVEERQEPEAVPPEPPAVGIEDEEGGGMATTGGEPPSAKREPKRRRTARRRGLYTRYRCTGEHLPFEIVTPGRTVAEAKEGACGGRVECMETTICRVAKERPLDPELLEE